MPGKYSGRRIAVAVAAVAIAVVAGAAAFVVLSDDGGQRGLFIGDCAEVSAEDFNGNERFYCDRYSWTFNAEGMEKKRTVTEPVRLGIQERPRSDIDGIEGLGGYGGTAVLLDYAYDGTLPGKAVLEYRIGEEHAGETLIYSEVRSRALVPYGAQKVLVDGRGWVRINMEHCSDWILYQVYNVDVESVTGLVATLTDGDRRVRDTAMCGSDLRLRIDPRGWRYGLEELSVTVNGDPVADVHSMDYPVRCDRDISVVVKAGRAVSGALVSDGPKSGVIVYFGDMSCVTDGSGGFEIHLPRGEFQLSFMKDGYRVALSEGQPGAVTVGDEVPRPAIRVDVEKRPGWDGRFTSIVYLSDGAGGYTRHYGTGSDLRTTLSDALGNAVVFKSNGLIDSVNGEAGTRDEPWVIWKESKSDWTVVRGSGGFSKMPGIVYVVERSLRTTSPDGIAYAQPSLDIDPTYFFFVQFREDYDANEYVREVFTEQRRRAGFWLAGQGPDAHEAFYGAISALGWRDLEFSDRDDFKGWVLSLLGLRDTFHPATGLWTYYNQYHWEVVDGVGRWLYNDLTMGHYSMDMYDYSCFAYVRTSAAEGEYIDIATDPSEIPWELYEAAGQPGGGRGGPSRGEAVSAASDVPASAGRAPDLPTMRATKVKPAASAAVGVAAGDTVQGASPRPAQATEPIAEAPPDRDPMDLTPRHHSDGFAERLDRKSVV